MLETTALDPLENHSKQVDFIVDTGADLTVVLAHNSE